MWLELLEIRRLHRHHIWNSPQPHTHTHNPPQFDHTLCATKHNRMSLLFRSVVLLNALLYMYVYCVYAPFHHNHTNNNNKAHPTVSRPSAALWVRGNVFGADSKQQPVAIFSQQQHNAFLPKFCSKKIFFFASIEPKKKNEQFESKFKPNKVNQNIFGCWVKENILKKFLIFLRQNSFVSAIESLIENTSIYVCSIYKCAIECFITVQELIFLFEKFFVFTFSSELNRLLFVCRCGVCTRLS